MNKESNIEKIRKIIRVVGSDIYILNHSSSCDFFYLRNAWGNIITTTQYTNLQRLLQRYYDNLDDKDIKECDEQVVPGGDSVEDALLSKTEFEQILSGDNEVEDTSSLPKTEKVDDLYENVNEIQMCFISVPTIRVLLTKKGGGDAIALYLFYYYTGKWQKTNMPKATGSYCQRGLHWSRKRFQKAHKILYDLDLISTVTRKNIKGEIVGWYTKVKYMLHKTTERTILKDENLPSSKYNPVDK